MVCGALLGSSTSAHAQEIAIDAQIHDGPTHQLLNQLIRVSNGAGGADATGVKVTFWPPKGAKVDTACQVDHFSGGLRSYTCFLGTLTPGQTVDIIFSISMIKGGDDYVVVEVGSDLDYASAALPIKFY